MARTSTMENIEALTFFKTETDEEEIKENTQSKRHGGRKRKNAG